jgi:hypothetical protein
MVASLVYRTADGTRWGGGQGSNLSAVTIDLNFWTLFTAVEALGAAQANGAGIDFISQPTNGNIIFVHLTDHRVLGPFTLPTAQWNPRGDWTPVTLFAPFDTVSNNGQLYLVTTPHTSAATFSPFATDGLGHALYVLILSAPASAVPVGGTIGQRISKSASPDFSLAWVSDRVRMYTFVAGHPLPGELLMQFPVDSFILLPIGLAGSVFYAHTGTALSCSYTLTKNGSPIGSIDFHGPSPETITATFPANIHCIPGDIISLIAPAVPDAVQADISFNIVSLLES